MKKTEKGRLMHLFWSVFRISACTFGGGFVIVPLMRKEFVEKLGWIEEQEMMDLTAIAQSAPGPIAVNAAILVGYHVRGVGGALLAALGTVLPPLVVISLISLFYQAFRDNHIVTLLMAGMLCGVAAVILDVVVKMFAGLVKQRRALPFLVLVAAFVAVRYLKAPILLVILVCGIIGFVDYVLLQKREKENEA